MTFCLSIIGGIFVGGLIQDLSGDIICIILIGLAVLGIIITSVFWSERLGKIIGLAILFFVLGVWRFEMSAPEINAAHIAYYNNQEEMSFLGIVNKEPDARDINTKLTVEAVGNYQGKILVTVLNYPQYHYGDKLKITCKLQTPKEEEDFSYKNYLSLFGIYSVCYPKEGGVQLLSFNNGNFIYAAILKLKAETSNVISKILPEPQASLLAGLTLGVRGNFPQKVLDDFSRVGITHIIAVSGFNITLISTIVMSILLTLGLWRKHAFYFAVLFLILYVILVGAPASAVRAGVMGFLFLLAQRLGRLNYSANAIVFAAAAMLAINPRLLPYDVGFQLSFAAILGLVYVYPIFVKWFAKLPELGLIKNIVLLTLAAQVATLPLLMFHFSKLSLISPIANILVVPFIPLITILGFCGIIFGFVYWLFGWIFSWLIWPFLTLILKVSDYLAQIPYSFLELKMQWWMVVIYYLVLIGFLVWYNKIGIRKQEL